MYTVFPSLLKAKFVGNRSPSGKHSGGHSEPGLPTKPLNSPRLASAVPVWLPMTTISSDILAAIQTFFVVGRTAIPSGPLGPVAKTVAVPGTPALGI
jgi:hypothetical protein